MVKQDYWVKQQYEVIQWGTSPFASSGDSGSLVFILNEEEELVCIGMVIGGTSYQTAIVTPIEAVLDAFGLQSSQMHTFTHDAMDE